MARPKTQTQTPKITGNLASQHPTCLANALFIILLIYTARSFTRIRRQTYLTLHSRRLGQETEGNEGATGAGLEGDEGDEGPTLLLEQTLKVSMAPGFDISRVMNLAGPRGA